MNIDIKFKMIEALKRRGAYHTSVNKVQHYTRCPFCGDSSNLSHAHLSIKIDTSNEDPMVYRCLKCSATGMVTDATIEELDIFLDKDSLTQLKVLNKRAMKTHKLVNLDIEKFIVPLYEDTFRNNTKLGYINNRLGLNLSLVDAQKYKLVLNLYEFMKENEMKELVGLTPVMAKLINNDYIGFLSCNNNCIVFRDITGKNKYRYFKYTLNQKNVNPDSFYALPNKIDLMYTDSINIHIAEGTFDIISIRENIVQSDDHNFFYAMCGFGGITVIKYLIHHGINTGINLHIYSDNDKKDWEHKKYLQKSCITEWTDHIYIHRNKYQNQKDYGVAKELIIDSQYKMK